MTDIHLCIFILQDANVEVRDAAPTESSIGAFWPQGSAQAAGSSGQAAQQLPPAGEPMETSQAPEASAQPMESSQAPAALQEDTAGPSEPGAASAAMPALINIARQ